MSAYRRQVDDLVAQAEALAYGPSRVALLEQAVHLADCHEDRQLGFDIRGKLVDAAAFSGQPDVMLVAFSWQLAQCDRAPEEFAEWNLLWAQKWVVGHLEVFPEIQLCQIKDAIGDMARRFKRNGATLRAVYSKRRDLAIHRGDRSGARRAQRSYERTRRDWLSDCPACEQDHLISYYRFLGDDEKAVHSAAPILAGHLKCGEVPHRPLAELLLPLVRLGRFDEAADCHRKGYRLIARNPHNFIAYLGMHLQFLALTDNLARGATLLEKHLPLALITTDVSDRFDFYLAARIFLDRLLDHTTETIRLRLPPSFPLYQIEGAYNVRSLAVWLTSELTGLANRFDARNGTRSFARAISGLKGLKKWARPYPLAKKKA